MVLHNQTGDIPAVVSTSLANNAVLIHPFLVSSLRRFNILLCFFPAAQGYHTSDGSNQVIHSLEVVSSFTIWSGSNELVSSRADIQKNILIACSSFPLKISRGSNELVSSRADIQKNISNCL